MYDSAASLLTAYGLTGRGTSDSCVGVTRWSPYTDEDDAKTICRTPASRQASRTASVPTTLTACVRAGSVIDRGTDDSAARWTTASAPRTARPIASPSSTLPTKSGTSRPASALATAVGQVVDHRHVQTRLQQGMADVAPDEAGPTGHENAHRVPLARQGTLKAFAAFAEDAITLARAQEPSSDGGKMMKTRRTARIGHDFAARTPLCG